MIINFFMNIPYIEKSYKTILFLYVISANDLLIGLCIAIFPLLHQRKNTLFYYRRTYVTYCLLYQSPHNQSLLAKVWVRKLSLSTILIVHLRRRWTYKIDAFTRSAKDSGPIYAFIGVGFVLIINLLSLVIDSHKPHLLLSCD